MVKVLTEEAGSSNALPADTRGTLPEETDVGLGGGGSVAPDGRGASVCTFEEGAGVEAEDGAGDADAVGAAVPGALNGAEDGTEDAAVLDGTRELGTLVPFVAVPFPAVPFPPPGTHPGTRSAAVASAGPSVTATQPGKFASMAPGSSFSPGTGFGAKQALFSSGV